MDTTAHVPMVFPSSNQLDISVVLQPDYSAIPAPLCRNKFGDVTCTPNEWLNKPLCQNWAYNSSTKDYGWQTYNCSTTNYVGIYYRDFWINNKLWADDCYTLWAQSFLMAGDALWLPDPIYLPYGIFARVEPGVVAAWDKPFQFYWYPGCN